MKERLRYYSLRLSAAREQIRTPFGWLILGALALQVGATSVGGWLEAVLSLLALSLLACAILVMGARRIDSGGSARVDEMTRQIADLRRDLAFNDELIRTVATSSRARIDRLARAVLPIPPDEVISVFDGSRDRPLLSIAIPAYGRATELATCLESVAREVENHGPDTVEVCISDDASPDPQARGIAHEFAQGYPWASFRANETNIGLERNLIEAVRRCTGDYVMLLGNDDALVDGALGTILGDLASTAHDLLLFEKTRVASDMSAHPPIPGSTPIDIEPGAAFQFQTPLAVAAGSGILSAFGFISQVVMRRKPFVAVSPEPYFELTLYPQVGMLMEAFWDSAVLYRNAPISFHRTTTQPEKLAEALGEREEPYMVGRVHKRAYVFGLRYAAFLERIIQRTGIDHAAITTLPERLFTRKLLVDWIAENVALGRQMGITVDPAVGRDATEFLAGVTRARSHRVAPA